MAIKKATTTADVVAQPTPAPAGEVHVKSPTGMVTTVPESLVEILLESGYVKVN